ncbi:MAG: aminodeoxychorismate synthase component I, partial [Desulfohalobiaceae bacterium]
MQRTFQNLEKIKAVHRLTLDLNEDFLSLASRFAAMPGTVLLLSGTQQDSSRYHILAVRPWIWLRSKNQDLELVTPNSEEHFQADPFAVLQELLSSLQLPPAADLPLQAGLLGYLAYDLKHRLEDLPRSCLDDLKLPDICLFAPRSLLIQDLASHETTLCLPELEHTGSWQQERDLFLQILEQPAPQLEQIKPLGRPEPNFSRSQYLQSVRRIQDYILDGHVYQVNLSQRFRLDCEGHPFSLFQGLFQRNPAPFYAFINCGDHQIISTSPERFLFKKGEYAETRPIKGTRPRGRDQDQDQELAHELLESPKDDAELSMIVDLLRNDLGKVCRAGTVRVQEHKRLESYHNVFHLVSIVQGQMEQGMSAVDLVRAAFPGGSITGCPKVRAMQIIDELEPQPRHIYTGSIGYFSFAGDLDLSIAIRTVTAKAQSLVFSVGGGIVMDSDPELEYEETLHKGQTLLQAFAAKPEHVQPQSQYLWQNGQILPLEKAQIPAWIPGLEYGFGLFETMLAREGRVLYLEQHIQRLTASWLKLWGTEPPELSWEAIISQVLEANQLQEAQAGVKILAAKGSSDLSLSNDQILVRAWPYTHRLHKLQKQGLDLLTHPEPRQTCLADHKTLNHLYYHLAGEWARSRGADEALILNPDHSVSEANSANILCCQGGLVLVPDSEHVLPGIMQRQALLALEEMGFVLRWQKLYTEDLLQADCVMLTNSLLSVVQALCLDSSPLRLRPDLVRKLQVRL